MITVAQLKASLGDLLAGVKAGEALVATGGDFTRTDVDVLAVGATIARRAAARSAAEPFALCDALIVEAAVEAGAEG